MPNWCNNNIEITGPAKTINAIWTAATAEGVAEGGGLLDAMVPMPKQLKQTVKGSGDELQTEVHDGFTNWYDWSVERWGTKWDVDTEGLDYADNGDGTASIGGYFDSAWSPPVQAMATYGEQNPDVSITLDYHEPGMCFVGRCTVTAGEAEDNHVDYSDETSETVRDEIGEDFDDMWGISESMAEWEEE